MEVVRRVPRRGLLDVSFALTVKIESIMQE